jgi:hypothetical protein
MHCRFRKNLCAGRTSLEPFRPLECPFRVERSDISNKRTAGSQASGRWVMDQLASSVIERLGTRPGQGSILEQVEKLLRRQQRRNLYAMLDQIDKNKTKNLVVTLDRCFPQIGRKRPALLRFSLPAWQGYDELFWQALGDYAILALHRVKDVEYDAARAKIKIQYFSKLKGMTKSPERIGEIIQGIAHLIDIEALPTDFTRFRRMAERRGSLGEMSKEEAAAIGAAIKLAFDLARI